MKRRFFGIISTAALLAAVAVFSAFAFGCSVFRKDSGDVLPHLISEDIAESDPRRPIDESGLPLAGFTSDTLGGQLDELTDMMFDGKKPDFATALSGTKKVYDAAVAVLDRYILNDFSEYERVHAIHDWIVYNTKYDFELLENADGASSDDPSFRADGVLLNGKAVCDGYTKAFRLMCGIERIRCIRVIGQYNDNGSQINHAWNKVRVGGVWYNVDTTMDNFHVMAGGKRKSVLNHGYFLVSDKAIKDVVAGRHTERATDPINVNYECKENYPFHATTASEVEPYSMRVTSQRELNSVFRAVKDKKGKIGKIELQLAFTGYSDDNLSHADAYSAQISEAYSLIKDADYRIDSVAREYPYMRYPNGVFVFLIYK